MGLPSGLDPWATMMLEHQVSKLWGTRRVHPHQRQRSNCFGGVLHRRGDAWNRLISGQIRQVVFMHSGTRNRFIGRKRQRIFKSGDISRNTGRGVGENRLIEYNITRDINMSCCYIKSLNSFMERAITKKNTPFGAEREFVFVVRTKIGPTSATKNSKRVIVWCDLEKFLCRSFKIENLCRKQINKKSGCEKGIIPIFQGHRSISEESKANLNNVAMFVFTITISLMSMRI